MPRRTAWLFEEADTETPLEVVHVAGGSGLGDSWYLATFGGHLDDGDDTIEGVPLDAALAWARERADDVVVRVGAKHYTVGCSAPDAPPLPDGIATRLVRRRFAGEEWKDRTPDDPPISWNVEAAVTPRFEQINRVIEDEARVDAEAEALIAALAPDRWSAEPVAAWRAFLRAQSGEVGWFAGGEAEPKWRLWFTVEAPTREQAVADVKARAPVLPGWELFARAKPADAGT